MRKPLCLALAVSLAALACAMRQTAAPKLETDDQKTLYALGLIVSDNLSTFNLSEADLAYVQAGITDGALHRERKVDLTAYAEKLQTMAQARAKAGAEADKIAGAAFLAKAAEEKGAVKTPAGFVIQEITPGNGASPAATDQVKVHYRGTLIDGTVFDSSIDRGEPAEFTLDRVIPCWSQGLQMMKVGSKSRLICPAELAYGDRGAPPRIRPGSTLVFEVELLDVVKK